MTPHEIQARATCGAALPDGRRCRCPPALHPQTGLPRNGRCVAHGGFSTGPKTDDGRRRAGEGFRRMHEARRQREGQR